MTTHFTDEQMRALMPTTRPYTAVILRPGPNRSQRGAEAIVWEHGRRNFRTAGVQAGVFVYEVYPTRSFPGDALPGWSANASKRSAMSRPGRAGM